MRVGNFIHSLGNDVLAVELKTIDKQLIHSFENISRGHFTKFVNITNLYFDVEVLKPKNKTLGRKSITRTVTLTRYTSVSIRHTPSPLDTPLLY